MIKERKQKLSTPIEELPKTLYVKEFAKNVQNNRNIM